jgi:Fur family transcriptional regulator, peroxide stress response regulator
MLTRDSSAVGGPRSCCARRWSRRASAITEQRSAVYRYLLGTDAHPTADDVFTSGAGRDPDISLATVYKSLETLVGCGLAVKLTYGDGSARYDARTDPHPHARCLDCGAVLDVPGRLDSAALAGLGPPHGFAVAGYRLELVGRCAACEPTSQAAPRRVVLPDEEHLPVARQRPQVVGHHALEAVAVRPHLGSWRG